MQVLDDQSEYICEELLENHQDFYTVFCGNLGFTEGLRTFFRGMRLQVGYFLKNEVRFSGVFLERVFLSFDVQIMLLPWTQIKRAEVFVHDQVLLILSLVIYSIKYFLHLFYCNKKRHEKENKIFYSLVSLLSNLFP